MNFYRRRPFALIITVSMLIYLIGAFADGWIRMTLGGIIILFSFLLVVLLRRRKDFRICGIPSALFLTILSAVLLISLLITHAFYDVYESRYRNFGNSSEVLKITAEILSVENDTAFSSTYRIKLRKIGDERVSATGLVYTEESLNIRPGTLITFDGEFCPLEDFYGYKDMSRVNILAENCVFTCRMNGVAKSVGQVKSISSVLNELRQNISAKIALYLDRDSAALSKAVLLGERDGLGSIYRDFTYTGTLHILALSGMHIVIIGEFLEKLMLRFKIMASARRISVCIFMILYAALTGFPLSVVRAVLMLLISNLMYLFKKDIDKITSLFIACNLIILFNPPAIYDLGLQLSFFATLGVLLLTEIPIHERFHILLERHPGLSAFLYRYRRFFSSVLASFGAAIFVIPLQWLYFGEMSLLTIPSTLILSPIFNLLLNLLLPYLAFCILDFEFICRPLSAVITALCRLTAKIAEILADFSPLISLRYPFVPVIIIGFVLAIAVMMAKNVRGWYKAVIPYILAVTVTVAGAGIYEASRSHTPTVRYAAVKSNDIFVVLSAGKSVVIDCTDGSSSAMYEAMGILADNYSTSVDTLIFTRLNSKHINAARTLLAKRKVASIMIPSSDIDSPDYIADRLLEIAEEYGASMYVYSRNSETDLTYGSLTLSIPKAVKISRSTRVLPALKFTAGGDTLAYIGRAAWEDGYIRDFILGSEHYIFGVNGPVFKGYDGSIDLDSTKFVFTADSELAEALSPYTAVTVDESLCVTFK